MTAEYLAALCELIEPNCGVLPMIGDRAEPLAAIYPAQAHVDLVAALQGADFSLRSVTARLVSAGTLRAVSVAQTDESFFRNLNQTADLEPTTNPRA